MGLSESIGRPGCAGGLYLDDMAGCEEADMKKKKVWKAPKPNKALRAAVKRHAEITAERKFFRVDIEFPFNESFKYVCLFEMLDEEAMKKNIQKLKVAGMGGRIALLDGTPDGKVQETWGSVERVAAAEKEEKQALTR
jgi:hypothetical protein